MGVEHGGTLRVRRSVALKVAYGLWWDPEQVRAGLAALPGRVTGPSGLPGGVEPGGAVGAQGRRAGAAAGPWDVAESAAAPGVEAVELEQLVQTHSGLVLDQAGGTLLWQAFENSPALVRVMTAAAPHELFKMRGRTILLGMLTSEGAAEEDDDGMREFLTRYQVLDPVEGVETGPDAMEEEAAFELDHLLDAHASLKSDEAGGTALWRAFENSRALVRVMLDASPQEMSVLRRDSEQLLGMPGFAQAASADNDAAVRAFLTLHGVLGAGAGRVSVAPWGEGSWSLPGGLRSGSGDASDASVGSSSVVRPRLEGEVPAEEEEVPAGEGEVPVGGDVPQPGIGSAGGVDGGEAGVLAGVEALVGVLVGSRMGEVGDAEGLWRGLREMAGPVRAERLLVEAYAELRPFLERPLLMGVEHGGTLRVRRSVALKVAYGLWWDPEQVRAGLAALPGRRFGRAVLPGGAKKRRRGEDTGQDTAGAGSSRGEGAGTGVDARSAGRSTRSAAVAEEEHAELMGGPLGPDDYLFGDDDQADGLLLSAFTPSAPGLALPGPVLPCPAPVLLCRGRVLGSCRGRPVLPVLVGWMRWCWWGRSCRWGCGGGRGRGRG
ncbi:hypothetical protein BX266_5587 [Streptomyces sp. TLI_171]|nr:hypothetical protein BX266_5587 [Streptomyces sp. TLI_171]